MRSAPAWRMAARINCRSMAKSSSRQRVRVERRQAPILARAD